MQARVFFYELRRRNVYRFTVAYAVVGWLVMQIATQVFPFLEIPNWAVRLVIVLLVLTFPIALVLAWVFDITPEGIRRTRAISPARAHSVVATATSIAVLPFEDVGDDRDASLSEGIQNDILSRLATPPLKVVSRTSVLHYRRGGRTARQIGEELGVRHVLEGMVRRSGNRLRVNAQLIDVENDTHVWSEIFDRTLRNSSVSDPFAAQTEVVERIVEAVRLHLLFAKHSLGK